VGADRHDSAKIIELQATPTRLTELRYEHVDCNAEADAAAKAESGMAICSRGEVSSTDPGPSGGPGISRAQFAPDVVILGSFGLGTFLNKPAPEDMNWWQLPAAERHITPAQLRAFLNSKDSSETQFRLHFNAEAQIDSIEEIYTP
jgi:hypothetical protein